MMTMKNMKGKRKKKNIRDLWIPESWTYNGSGYQKVKKKLIPRKHKYKKIEED